MVNQIFEINCFKYSKILISIGTQIVRDHIEYLITKEFNYNSVEDFFDIHLSNIKSLKNIDPIIRCINGMNKIVSLDIFDITACVSIARNILCKNSKFSKNFTNNSYYYGSNDSSLDKLRECRNENFGHITIFAMEDSVYNREVKKLYDQTTNNGLLIELCHGQDQKDKYINQIKEILQENIIINNDTIEQYKREILEELVKEREQMELVLERFNNELDKQNEKFDDIRLSFITVISALKSESDNIKGIANKLLSAISILKEKHDTENLINILNTSLNQISNQFNKRMDENDRKQTEILNNVTEIKDVICSKEQKVGHCELKSTELEFEKVPYFIRKDNIYKEVSELLENQNIIEKRNIIVLRGLSGIGKTSFLIEYLRSQQQKGVTVRYIDCNSINNSQAQLMNIKESFKEMAKELKVKEECLDNDKTMFQELEEKFEQFQNNNFLFGLDNIENITLFHEYLNFLYKLKVKIIMTSKREFDDATIYKYNIKVIEMEFFNKNDANEYINLSKVGEEYLNNDQRSLLIEKISDSKGNIWPHTLCLAIKLLTFRPYTFDEVIKELQKDKTLIKPMFDKLNEYSKSVIKYAAYLNGGFINQDFIYSLVFGTEQSQKDKLKECFEELINSSLIKTKMHMNKIGISVLELVQINICTFIANENSNDEMDILIRITRNLNNVFEEKQDLIHMVFNETSKTDEFEIEYIKHSLKFLTKSSYENGNFYRQALFGHHLLLLIFNLADYFFNKIFYTQLHSIVCNEDINVKTEIENWTNDFLNDFSKGNPINELKPNLQNIFEKLGGISYVDRENTKKILEAIRKDTFNSNSLDSKRIGRFVLPIDKSNILKLQNEHLNIHTIDYIDVIYETIEAFKTFKFVCTCFIKILNECKRYDEDINSEQNLRDTFYKVYFSSNSITSEKWTYGILFDNRPEEILEKILKISKFNKNQLKNIKLI